MSETQEATPHCLSGSAAATGRTEIVWVSGSDSVSFLDGLLSQNIAAIEVGGTAPSLLLAPNGKLRATLLVLRGQSRIGLACDAGRGEIVVSDLLRFKIRVDVSIGVETDDVWDVWGTDAAAAVGRVPQAGRWDETNGSVRFRMPFRHPILERVIVVGMQPDVPLVTPVALEPIRIEVGEPVMGLDLTDKTIPQEGVDVAATVDFAKGCYLGQELVARIDSRGHVNRRLVGLLLDDAVVAGTEVTHQKAEVGSVTSVAWSQERGRFLGLGMVRTSIESGWLVEVGGASARVVDLPMSW